MATKGTELPELVRTEATEGPLVGAVVSSAQARRREPEGEERPRPPPSPSLTSPAVPPQATSGGKDVLGDQWEGGRGGRGPCGEGEVQAPGPGIQGRHRLEGSRGIPPGDLSGEQPQAAFPSPQPVPGGSSHSSEYGDVDAVFPTYTWRNEGPET